MTDVYTDRVSRKPKEPPNERAAWVRDVRETIAKMTQEQFADAINASRPAISNWERGEYVPEWDSIQKIIKAFPQAPRPPFGPNGAMSDPDRTVSPQHNAGVYVVKTDQGRIIAKMIDAIEDESARTDAMLACAAELKKNPSELDAEQRSDRAQRSK